MAIIVFLVAFGTYAWTASPVASWLDSAEFVAASTQLGVSHSPGHPLPTLLGHAATLIPLGDASLRVNLATSFEGAIAVTLLYVVASRFAAHVAPALGKAPRAIIGAAVALGFAFSWACWYQSVRAEVYVLEASLLFLALGWLLHHDATGDRRALVAAGFAVGLALANHHFITILFFVPAAAAALARRPGVRAAGATALIGVLGLAAFLYLPVRATRGPEVNWGDPQTAGRFAWTISAQAFQKSLAKAPHESRAGEATKVLAAILEQLHPAVVLAALIGVYLLLRRRETRRVGAMLAGIAVLVAAGPAAIGFDPDNPDAYGYLLPSLGAIAVLAAGGIALAASALATAAPRQRTAILVTVCAAIAIVPALQVRAHAAHASLRGGHTPDTYAHAVIDDLPPRAVLFTSYYETAFQLWALRAVEGARPDLTIVDRGFLTYPGFGGNATRRDPQLAPLVGAGFHAGRPAPMPELVALAAARPVVFELAIDLDPALAAHLVPDGRTAWFLAPPPNDDVRVRMEARDRAKAAALEHALADAPPGEQAGATRQLLWGTFLAAKLYCDLGRAAAAQATLAALDRLDPDDPMAGDLAAHCAVRSTP